MAISILVIDGESSSYSGVSSAMFNLREIMHRAAPDSERSDTSSQTSSNGGNDEARPCDCFDLIVGSGDGGWVAIMLGRLGMSVSQAINAYKEIHSAVHHAPQKLSKQERSAIFENHLKRLVQTHSVGGNPEEKLRMSKSGVRCQTVVLAMTSQNVALPTLFRTYKARKHRVDDCPVWMAIRACTSNPHLFPAAKIGDQLYVSASHAGQSNPIDFALSEAKVAYPDAGIHCIISLGSGHPGPISFSMPDMSSYSDVAINIAKDAERKAQQAAKQFHSTDQKIYFRFNVEQGLQNSVQATSGPHGEAQAHAAVYCARHEIDELLEAAVTQLLSSNCVDEKVPPSLQEGADSFEVQVSSIPQTQTYVNELYPLGFGFPLWDPHPRSKPIEFGDVGVLTQNGGFEILFNATISAAEQNLAGFKVPKDFVPLQVQSFSLDPVPEVMQDPYLISDGVKLNVEGLGMQPNDSPLPRQQKFKLTFQVAHGAAVIFNDPPHRVAVDPSLVIESYLRKHCKSWYAFCRHKKGLGRAIGDYELIMITGLHQNARWAVGAWSKSNAQNRISYSGTATMVEGGPNVLQGTWIPKVGSGTKQGPSTARASMVRRGRFRSLGSFDAMDQTLFIEGYKLGMRSRPFPNIILPSIPFDEPRWLSAAKKAFRHRLPLIIRASAEPQDLPPPPSPDPDAAAFLVQDEPENGSEGDVQLLKVYPKLKHPLDHCLDIFFQNTSETDIFVVHDRTLVAAINEEHPLHLDLKEKVPRGSVNGDNQPIWNDASSSVPSIGPSSLFDVISEPSTGITTMPSTAHSSPYAYLPDDRRPESVSVGDDEIEDKPRFSKRRGEGGDRSSGNCVVQ